MTQLGGIQADQHVPRMADAATATALEVKTAAEIATIGSSASGVRIRYPLHFKVTAYTDDRWVGSQYAQPITEIWTTNLGTATEPAFPARVMSVMDLPLNAVIESVTYSVTQDSGIATQPSSFEWRLVGLEKPSAGSYQGTDTNTTIAGATQAGLPANITESLYGEAAIGVTMAGTLNHVLLAVRPIGSSANSKRLNFQMAIDVTLP